ncbi:hypothetical protein [Ferroplasma sp.]|uniref:hypothetical protein n=1 Tax=Ferroplasma sp. TaxID=2591003 RepID=UPI00307FCA04
MANIYLAIGVIFLIMSALSFALGIYYLGIVLLIVFIILMFMFYKSSALHVNKRVSSITYDGIIRSGLSKIEKGTLNIEKAQFISVMGKINDLVSSQGTMPEFGIDAVYLEFNRQDRAEKLVELIKERGVNASATQERSLWKVKIDFT